MNAKNNRLDQELAKRGLVISRSQAESYIKLGKVRVNGRVVQKTSFFVDEKDEIELEAGEKYVSRAALKLASVSEKFKLDFSDKVVLDIGSSTGGFTDYALQHGAKKVIAVDVGTNQLHPSLQNDPRIELHEKTDIRDFNTTQKVDIVLADVSFISLRKILPSVKKYVHKNTILVTMCKPQFEAGRELLNKGVIKNSKIRRDVLKDFELWLSGQFIIIDKADSEVSGEKGNVERFYLLKYLG